MSTPPTLPNTLNNYSLQIPLEPLSPASFAPFGTAISTPFISNLNTPPSNIPAARHAPQQPAAVFANQQSALKTSPISVFENNYPNAPAAMAKPQMSMFSCFPRNLSGIGIVEDRGSQAKARFKVNILERHPYTTQTFAPLGLPANVEDESRAKTFFLVIVAPSLHGTTTTASESTQITSPPDLSRLRAFIARGDQAVTYGAGTWHAPMVVLGERRVDFLVTQFVNGVAHDDCQEVLMGESNQVHVALDGLGLDFKSSTREDLSSRHKDSKL
jgi:ureidoglycolate lyase